MSGGLIAKNFKEFLQQNGYEWSGYIAQNCGKGCENYYKCDKYLRHFDQIYMLMGSHYDFDEDCGLIDIKDKSVKYIRHDEVTFKLYQAKSSGKFELEKDLSDEWVRYQALNIDGYARSVINLERYIQLHYPKDIENRKNLLAQEIERITSRANESIKYMEERVARSKVIEDILNEVVEWEV